jgi:hypothetical protein
VVLIIIAAFLIYGCRQRSKSDKDKIVVMANLGERTGRNQVKDVANADNERDYSNLPTNTLNTIADDVSKPG